MRNGYRLNGLTVRLEEENFTIARDFLAPVLWIWQSSLPGDFDVTDCEMQF
jgi:hypothetical protein